MPDDNRSQFHFESGGIEVEITGSAAFVGKIDRRIMRNSDRSSARR